MTSAPSHEKLVNMMTKQQKSKYTEIARISFIGGGLLFALQSSNLLVLVVAKCLVMVMAADLILDFVQGRRKF